MKVVSISNQKGGVGKTTINVAAFLMGKFDKRVLVIDLDPQQNLCMGVGVHLPNIEYSVYDCLIDPTFPIYKAIIKSDLGFDLLPASPKLTQVEGILHEQHRAEWRLHDALQQVKFDYDIVLIDCPPSFGTLTLNALIASQRVVVPVEPAFLSMQGVARVAQIIDEITRMHEVDIDFSLLLSRFETRTRAAKEIHVNLLDQYQDKIFSTYIRKNVKLEECMGYGIPISEYDNKSTGYIDFYSFTKELMSSLS